MAAENTELNTSLFMEEVQKCPAIYNRFSKDYKNKFIRMNILKAIGEKFRLDAAKAENIRMSEPRMGDTWEKKKACSDWDDHMEISSRPNRLGIFGNDWDDPDDHMETRLKTTFERNYSLE